MPHLRSTYAKLGAKSRRAATSLAMSTTWPETNVEPIKGGVRRALNGTCATRCSMAKSSMASVLVCRTLTGRPPAGCADRS